MTVLSDTVTRFFATETCVEVSSPAQVRGLPGSAVTVRACDNGQGGGFFRDFFRITVFDSAGNILYTREGNLTGGNLQASLIRSTGEEPR